MIIPAMYRHLKMLYLMFSVWKGSVTHIVHNVLDILGGRDIALI